MRGNLSFYRGVSLTRGAAYFALFLSFSFVSVLAAPIFETPFDDEALSLQKSELPKLAFEEVYFEASFGPLPALWHIQLVGADLAKQDFPALQTARASVAVFDSGSPQADEDLNEPNEPKRWIELESLFGWKFRKPLRLRDPRDFVRPGKSDHGEHVAGTIGAGQYKFGVSPSVYLYSSNIFDTPKDLLMENLSDHFERFATTGAYNSIVNLSLHLPDRDDFAEYLNHMIVEKNASVVIAAGNSGTAIQEGNLLNSIEQAVVVSAFASSGFSAPFSSYGNPVDIMAPGSDIISQSRMSPLEIEGQKVRPMSGTSMAAPMVTGSLANLRTLLPEVDQRVLQEIIFKTAWDIQAKGWDPISGHGLLNTYKATFIADRLREHFPNQKQELEMALQNDEFWSTAAAHKRAIVEKNKHSRMSLEWEQGLRRQALLGDSIQSLTVLAITYSHLAPSYSNGLLQMISSHENSSVSAELAKSLADVQFRLILQGAIQHPSAREALRQIHQPQLMLEVTRKLVNRNYIEALEDNNRLLDSYFNDPDFVTDVLAEYRHRLAEKKLQALMDEFENIYASCEDSATAPTEPAAPILDL